MDAIERRLRRLEEAMRVEDEMIVYVKLEVVTDTSEIKRQEPQPSPVPPGFKGRIRLVVINETETMTQGGVPCEA